MRTHPILICSLALILSLPVIANAEAAGQPYVFDCGRGCGIRDAYDGEVQSRGFGGHAPSQTGLDQQVTIINGDGVVLEENGVKITAFVVEHYRGRLALGFRIDYNGRSVVISGDTKPSENLLKYANGVDLLLHEVVDPMTIEKFRAKLPEAVRATSVPSIHTTAIQGGEIFQKSSPRLATYYHHNANSTEAEDLLVQETRQHYSGPLQVGQDMMTILIGDKIEMRAGH